MKLHGECAGITTMMITKLGWRIALCGGHGAPIGFVQLREDDYDVRREEESFPC